MARSKSSSRWLQEHFNDEYVKRSQQDGYRSRASYKLLEIQEKYRIFKPGMRVLDLGAAPGGWSQVAISQVGKSGKVIASDILPMEPIRGVTFIQGDFTDEEVYQNILFQLKGEKLDLVISDMAPNMSGISSVDIPQANYLVELALDISCQALSPGGSMLVKIFQGEGFDELLSATRSKFKRVQMRKPDASRSRSREQYMLADDFKG